MRPAGAAGLVLALLASAPFGVPRDPSDALQRGRTLIRQGLFREAEAELVPLVDAPRGDASTEEARAHAALLLGNIAFERGHYTTALERYAIVLADPEATPGLSDAARSNSERSHALVARQEDLDRRAGVLLLAAVLTTAAGAVACVWLGRRARA